MSSRQWVLYLGCLTPLLLLAACDEGESEQGGGDWTNVCIDADGDGHGLQCPAGPDCDDSDRTIFTGCARCDKPNEGCPCEPGSDGISCTVAPEVTSAGSLLCHEGTRYCRNGAWSACEGIASFTAPPPSEVLGRRLSGLVSVDGAVSCGACSPDCFEIEDRLLGTDGGTATLEAGTGVTAGPGGSITLGGSSTDAGVTNPNEPTPIPPCNMMLDSDCDGIPNTLDPYPSAKPFETTNTTIVMDLPPGTSKSNTFDLRFYLRSADVYFLIDMTGSMNEEKSNLFSSLKTGGFLDDPTTTLVNEQTSTVCADANFDGVPDNELKTRGIAGNIACLIRDAAFGAGWYREIPFSASDSNGIHYGPANFEPFEHRMDIRSGLTGVDALESALGLFATRGNYNWAEAATVALSAVATGGPIYMGWDRSGIPQRTCANGGFGYPCFRPGAVPIVVLITDAPAMNGPTPTSLSNLGPEAVGRYTVRQAVNYDSQVLRYMSKSSDGVYNPVSGNESFATAYDVGAIDNSFKTYTGDTRSMAADIHAANLGTTCSSWPSNASSASSAGFPDAVFRFSVASTKTLTLSTRGTRFKPTLVVRPASPTATTNVSAASNATPAAAQNLGTLGSSFAYNITGNTDPSTFTTSDLPASSISECLRGASVTTDAPDAWFTFTVAQNMNNVRFAVDGSDFDGVLGLWAGAAPTATTTAALGTNDKYWTTAAALTPGTSSSPGDIAGRSVWLSGGSTSASGFNNDYNDNLFSNFGGSCGNVYGDTNDAVVDFRVTGGPKTVRLETTGSSNVIDAASFDHVVGLFARPASGSLGAALDCDMNGAGSRRAFIERTLNDGTYTAVIRGERRAWWTNDEGSYGLLISDGAKRPVACHLESASSSFSANLVAGVTYYLGMRGRSTSNGGGRGPYTIRIDSHTDASVCAFDNTSYSNSDDYDQSLGAAEISRTFAPGDYYAIIKGAGKLNSEVPDSDSGRGWYQFTLGDAALGTSNQTATMPVWGTSTSGVYKQLADKGIRVITVASTKPAVCGGSWCSGGAADANTALVQQGAAIGVATGATNTNGTGLVFEIGNDGNGMGNAIVNAIGRLSNNLSMNVSVRHVPLPDSPSKPFTFAVRAISTGGNSCSGTSDSDGDGVQDTHLGCRPGAAPRFQVTFGNPASPNNVPPNPAPGSNGGYNMKIELVADNQYVIDSIPVFIIPEDVIPDPPTYQYGQTGWYTQDIVSSCAGTDRPNWQSLSWNATIPSGTSIVWKGCLGDTTADLDSCAAGNRWRNLATVTSGSSCQSSSSCTNGYCSVDTCHYPVADSSCGTDADCGTGGVCSANVCRFTENPISLLSQLSGLNGLTRIRLRAELNANPGRTSAPTLQSFKTMFLCSPGV